MPVVQKTTNTRCEARKGRPRRSTISFSVGELNLTGRSAACAPEEGVTSHGSLPAQQSDLLILPRRGS